jgi:DNA-binding NtrC family response regulator
MNKVLVVDDDSSTRFTIGEFLSNSGFAPVEAQNGRVAIDIFKKEEPLLVLLDLAMPEMDGIECMRRLRDIDPTVPAIMVTGQRDVSCAVEAMKVGAYDYVVKPPDYERLMLTIKRAAEKAQLERTITTSFETLFGRSKAMKVIAQQVRQVAQSDFSVILQGETGTGKSFIARTIHDFSTRASGPFVKVDMGALPENLVESELFGYEKGAFTGAEKKKKGFFEVSHGGTILIDELQNASPYVQSRLLRVAEEKRLFPLGDTSPVEVDTRIISASNADLTQAMKEKKIREDLYYRLAEFTIDLPPLRDRVADIPFLALKFFREATEELRKGMREITDAAMDMLTGYTWPGNIRELKNVIRRAVLLCPGDTIKPEHIGLTAVASREENIALSSFRLREVATDAEKNAIRQALSFTNGNRTKAAHLLEISHSSLLRKMSEYNIN